MPSLNRYRAGKYKTAILLVGVCIAFPPRFAMAQAVNTPDTAQAPEAAQPVKVWDKDTFGDIESNRAEMNKVVKTLRSDMLKAEVMKQGPLLLARKNVPKIKEAANFFHDLKAQSILLYALETRPVTDVSQAHTASALYDIIEPGSKPMARSILHQLQQASDRNRITVGGGESGVFLMEYQHTLIRILEKLSGKTLLNDLPRNEYGILRRFTSEEVSGMNKTVEVWLAA